MQIIKVVWGVLVPKTAPVWRIRFGPDSPNMEGEIRRLETKQWKNTRCA